jgi:TPR repeat protein
MRNLTTTLCLTIAVLLGSVGVSSGNDIPNHLVPYKSDSGIKLIKIKEHLISQNTLNPDEKAFKKTKAAAERGDASSFANLAMMFKYGEGTPRNHRLAVYWMTKAATTGKNSGAQTTLGQWYLNGEGVLQDYAQAMKWFRLAASQGDILAMVPLGLMYGRGQGEHDLVKAHMWLNIGASMGLNSAKKWLPKVTSMLKPPAINLAQKMARRCMASGYKNCE